MGIPKFYQSLRNRYPTICQTLNANQLPEYDYFYIDLNILLHKAVTKNNHLPHERFDDGYFEENRIFERVFRWIETLYRLIQPAKLFYLASDGVAPCAKWRTQRLRRMDESKYSACTFDARCISPGTEFMVKFEAALIDFATSKMKFDRLWQKCEIVINGSSCAGEGSMKIVEYIRTLKFSSEYFPLAKHCIYSADNDFLLLGIATRELNVTIIQEPRGIRNPLKTICSDDTKYRFDVIHFEILREYLRLEFIECADRMAFKFDADRIADDWVLLCILLGNDYVPQMPNFDFNVDILSLLCDTYREALGKIDGYLHENGKLALSRFEYFINILRAKDFDWHRQILEKQIDVEDKEADVITSRMAEINISDRAKFTKELTFHSFLLTKDSYYEKQFHGIEPELPKITHQYINIVGWTLSYFFDKTPSWSSYYKYPCAPYISDLTAIDRITFDWCEDKQPKPFDHLFAILPDNCLQLLPKCYTLLRDENAAGNWRYNKNKLEYITRDLNKSFSEAEIARNTWNVPSRYSFMHDKKVSECLETTVHCNRIMDLDIPDDKVLRPSKNHLNSALSTFPLLMYTANFIESNGIKKLCFTVDNPIEGELESVAEDHLNKVVNIGWPFGIEAKIVAVMNAEKTYRSPNDQMISMQTEHFAAKLAALQEMYDKYGIDVGEIVYIAIARPIIGYEYKARAQDHVYDLIKHFGYDQPVAVQLIVKETKKYVVPMVKFLNNELKSNGQMVFMDGEQSKYFGESVTIAKIDELATTNRINILGYADMEPDFTIAQEKHATLKANATKGFINASSAATSLSISPGIFSFITGTIFVTVGHPSNTTINIGLQLKKRYHDRRYVKESYVKSIGNVFIYSPQTVELVAKYLRQFPRMFIILSKHDSATSLTVQHFDENREVNGLGYLKAVTEWLADLPCQNEQLKNVNTIDLPVAIYDDIKRATQEAITCERKTFKLKVKWQNLFIPDMHSFTMNPCPEATYKLLDRIIIVRHGYPMSVGAKGTIVSIVPVTDDFDDGVADSNVYSVDILMDLPYRIKSKKVKFDWHQIYRTQSMNMLMNISYGRYN